MDISDELLALFSATVDEQHDSYIIEIPKREISLGNIHPDEVYRVALLANQTDDDDQSVGGATDQVDEVQQDQQTGPPVEVGDQRTVEIEDIGDQGDGIARVERGYVIIVPETEQGDQVTIEITDVRENVAFADVVEHHAYYE